MALDFHNSVTLKVEKEAVLGANKKFEKILGSSLTLSDDGYSGTNFERPSWKKVIELIEADEVESLIVKDGAVEFFARIYLPGA